MRIQVDVVIPQRTKWLVGGLMVGALLGLGVARVYADPVAVKTNWQPGDPLTSADLNRNFKKLQDAVNALVPAGTVIAYGGPVGGNPGTLPDGGSALNLPPPGWLLCNGDAVSRTTYAALFAAITTAHGGGDGIKTFNLPDLRGRSLFAASGRGTFAAVGATGGSETHTHAEAAHSHTVASHHHAISSDGAHTHALNFIPYISGGGWSVTVASQTDPAGSHNHTGATSDESPLTDSQQPTIGTSSNIPPFAVVTYIIKY